jgi:2-iminobutanoate/2-iminopropanoate deaminase
MNAAPPHFSPTREAAGLIFVSGQLAFQADGRTIAGDIVGQTLLCLERIEEALRAEGLTRAAIVRCGCWLARAEEFAAFNAAYARFFGAGVAPARTTLVAGFCVPGALVEIDAIAARSD